MGADVPLDRADAGDHFHSHIWLMPWPMLHTFVVAFFYDSLLRITKKLWDPFGFDNDHFSLDPILVLAERAIFANMGHSESNDMPESLHKIWISAKEKAKDKDKAKDAEKDEDKDKAKDIQMWEKGKKEKQEADKAVSESDDGKEIDLLSHGVRNDAKEKKREHEKEK